MASSSRKQAEEATAAAAGIIQIEPTAAAKLIHTHTQAVAYIFDPRFVMGLVSTDPILEYCARGPVSESYPRRILISLFLRILTKGVEMALSTLHFNPFDSDAELNAAWARRAGMIS